MNRLPSPLDRPAVPLRTLIGIGLLGAILLLACVPLPTSTATPPPLIPYPTRTPTLIPTIALLPTISLSISPTPTPFTYVVQPGDTMSAIAARFGVSLEALMAANPTVLPNLLPIGATLIIPTDPDNPAGPAPPTPAPFTISQASCYPLPDDSLYCLALVQNDGPQALENLSARLVLFTPNGQFFAEQTAVLPFNRLSPGMALPIAALFPSPLPPDVQLRLQPISAIALPPDDPRFLETTLSDLTTQPAPDGRTVRISGQVLLPSIAQSVWIIAIAYDKHDRVVGFRRWERQGPIPSGALPFVLTVAGFRAIGRVKIFVEAQAE